MDFFRTYLQTIIIEGHLFSKKQINQMKKLLPSIFSPEGIVVLHFFLFRYFQLTNSDVTAHLSIYTRENPCTYTVRSF